MVKIHFLQKVLKKWSSFRKNYFIFFPKVEFSTFFEPFPNPIFVEIDSSCPEDFVLAVYRSFKDKGGLVMAM